MYFALRGKHDLGHEQALMATEEAYLLPILRWVHGSPWHKKHGGINFWTVLSMDLGRQDFPRAAAWLRTWSVGSLSGDPTWLWASGAVDGGAAAVAAAMSPVPIAGSQLDPAAGSCWIQDTRPVTATRLYQPQDSVIYVYSRFKPAPPDEATAEREVLAFFAGTPNSCARRRAIELLANKPDFAVFDHILPSNETYRFYMNHSKFCLVMCGSTHTNNVRLIDAMMHGCVPVVISDDFQPPLEWWLPWQQMAIFLPTAALPLLEPLLRGEAREGWRRRHELLLSGAKAAAKYLDWRRVDYWAMYLYEVAEKLAERGRHPDPEDVTAPAPAAKVSYRAPAVLAGGEESSQDALVSQILR